MPGLTAHCRETVLSGRPLQSALSHSYIASVYLGTDQRNSTVPVPSVNDGMGVLLRSGRTRSQHTNVDSMLRFVVSPELQGKFGQHQSHATLNFGARNPTYEAKARRLLGESASSIKTKVPGVAMAAGRSRLQTIELAEGTIAVIAKSGLFQFQAGISLLRGICLQLPISLNDKPQRRAAHQTSTLTTVRSASLDAQKTVQAVAMEIVGTNIDMNESLMSVGLDSLSAVEFTNTLAARLSMDLEPTILFHHPTLDSLAQFLSSELQSNEVDSKTSG